MKFIATLSAPPQRIIPPAAARYIRDVLKAAVIATDRASKEAQRGVQERVSGTGLGRLSGAVGHTSSKLKGLNGRPYGVIFARGGDQSRAGGALEAYSRGAVIRPTPGKQWLTIATKAVPRFVVVDGKRTRTTPDTYMKSGLVATIGPLEFRPLAGGNRAIWVVKKVSVSPKTGRAKALGPRRTRTRVPEKEVIAFIGIRVTKRAQRFNKDGVVGFYARRVPRYMEEALAQITRGR